MGNTNTNTAVTYRDSLPEEAIPFVTLALLLVGLFILTIFYFRFRPDVSFAEREFLEELARRELKVLVIYPWISVMALGVLQLVPFPMYWALDYLKYFTIVQFHGFIPLIRWRRHGGLEGGMKYGKICRTVLIAYLILSACQQLLICGVFGFVLFDSGDNIEASGFPFAHYKVDLFGRVERVSIVPALGFKTWSQSPTKEGLLTIVHFWVWEQIKILAFRRKVYFWFFVSELIDKMVEVLQNDYIYD